MPHSQMLINYVPGEECRVAIVEDGKLEELYVERFSQASRVGNIYVGRVVNVEPAIQAAFVDFGVGDNGFLHVTDLHPKYFPGEDDETTERVGFKTPRRERPPIQAALRRGDEVIVQVLKEGVGTKGPTVTSYLSIPGRFLVMMPGMDRVGVSRKVEDEDLRRQMREILDQLELPEGFGFILRTAGMQRTKAELKRDLAYLQRLWKDMDRRLKAGGKPRLLYSESDLLVRALRDVLSNDIQEVVIDHPIALQRASRFMKIVAPRGTTKLMHYPGQSPLFHAFGLEKQISLIHAREVPLPSGGRLVIDQTEALVAIDVNSGKSRESRNSEDNAYQTNIEAVDEICRQLRLRDMGGIVINDLIDMRHASHRKDIENRFRERLKRDRAKTTITGISEFGILEMTRQRMRPSHESVHFTDCPTCRGRGMLQRPESVAADALRELAAILAAERTSKVELVVAPRVAGELLSTKRALLGRIERAYGKHVDVRVSETVAVDRVSFYAYDPAGADIDVGNLPAPKRPALDLKQWEDPDSPKEWALDEDAEKSIAAEPEPDTEAEVEVHPIEIDEPEQPDNGSQPETEEEGQRRGRRRRRRRGRGARPAGNGEPAPQAPENPEDQIRGEQDAQRDEAAEFGGAPAEVEPREPAGEGERRDGEAGEPGEGGRRRRRRRRRRGRGGSGGPEGAPPEGRPDAAADDRRHDRREERRDDRRDSRPPHSPETGGEWGDDGRHASRHAASHAANQDAEAADESPEVLGPAEPDDRREPVRTVDGDEMAGEFETVPPRSDRPDHAANGNDEDEQDDTEGDAPGTSSDRGEVGPDGQREAGPGEAGPGEDGQRRRRRRRRRRGRGNGAGAPGAPTGAAPAGAAPEQAPRSSGYSNPRSGPPRSGVGSHSNQGHPRDKHPQGQHAPREGRRDSHPRPPEPRPATRPPETAPPPIPEPKPRPRTLYSGVKRRLSPSELNKRPKPE